MSPLYQPACVWDLKATLGEGPVWSARDHALWFTDIKEKKLHRYDVTIGSKQTFHAPSEPGFIAPVRRGGFVIGCKTGLYRFDPVRDSWELLTQVEPGLPTNRLNDGCVDAQGRLWFGSMDDDETHPTGKLYRFDARGLKMMDEDYVITNGPAVSPDGRTLYHNDTLKKHIYAFDLDDHGDLSNKRLFAELDGATKRARPSGAAQAAHYDAHGEGFMDGPVVDSAGNVWVGLFFGWGVNVYAPSGKLIRRVDLPVSNVTKVAFGWADLKTVYVTSAAKGLSQDERKAQPLAGGLFAFQTETPGQPQNEITFL